MYDYNDGEPERLLTKDDFLDNVTLYWLTNSAASSARLYWETSGQSVLLAAAGNNPSSWPSSSVPLSDHSGRHADH